VVPITRVLIIAGRHLLVVVVASWILASLAFALLRLAPGGPYDSDRHLRPELRIALDASYLPEGTLWAQYSSFLWRAVGGDLGPSMLSPDRSVAEVLRRGFPPSAALCGGAFGFALLIGVGGGLLAALGRGGAVDRAVWSSSVLGLGIPGFVLAPLLVLLLAVELQWLPPAGYGSWCHLVLPMICLGASTAAVYARAVREVLLVTLEQEHLRVARARGMGGWRLARRHLFRPVMAAVTRRLGTQMALMIAGALAIEMLFEIPGVGHHVVRAVGSRDITFVVGSILTASFVLLVLGRLTRVAHGWLAGEWIRE
jgi:oligopeptide transport system permease protein